MVPVPDGSEQMDPTQSDEGEGLYLWFLYQTDVNNVNKPLVTITIDDSPVRVTVDTGSSFNFIDEKTFQSLKQRPSLTKEHNPVIPYSENPMYILGTFDAEIERNQMAVKSTVYMTGEGKRQSPDTPLQLG